MRFSDLLAELMTARDLSNRELARLVPCDRSYVTLLLQGRRQPSPEMAVSFDRALGAGGKLAALALQSAPPATAPGGDELLAGFPLAAHADRADAAYVADLRAVGQHLVSMDTAYGGGDVLPMALRVFRAAAGLLAAGAYEPAIERDLRAATGEAGEIAAWAAFDAEKQELSRFLILEAMLSSRMAGDRDMELFQLSHLSMQGIWLGRPGEALGIAEYVLSQPRLPARVRAVFELRKGRALAQLGDQSGGLDAVDHALVTFADGSSPAWTWWVGPAEILGHRGHALADGGDWQAAIPMLEQSAQQRGPGRDRYFSQTRLLEALAYVSGWTDAEPVIGTVSGMAGAIASPRADAILRRTARRIAAEAPPNLAESARELSAVLAEKAA